MAFTMVTISNLLSMLRKEPFKESKFSKTWTDNKLEYRELILAMRNLWTRDTCGTLICARISKRKRLEHIGLSVLSKVSLTINAQKMA